MSPFPPFPLAGTCVGGGSTRREQLGSLSDLMKQGTTPNQASLVSTFNKKYTVAKIGLLGELELENFRFR